MYGQNLTKFCIHIIIDKIYVGIVNRHFSQICNRDIGHFQSIKTDVLQIFSFITGDKTEFLSPMMLSN